MKKSWERLRNKIQQGEEEFFGYQCDVMRPMLMVSEWGEEQSVEMEQATALPCFLTYEKDALDSSNTLIPRIQTKATLFFRVQDDIQEGDYIKVEFSPSHSCYFWAVGSAMAFFGHKEIQLEKKKEDEF